MNYDIEKELKEIQIQYDKVLKERNELEKENKLLKKDLEVLEILKKHSTKLDEEDNKVIETALKEYELMKQTKIITFDKEISNDDLEKLTHQRMFVAKSKQCEIKPLPNEEANGKLHKILEIEEELGIDLVTLFSALKNGVYYFAKQNQLMFDYVSLISNYIDVGPHDKLSYSFITFYDRQTLSFEDYGKTFSLTREELEDE